MADLVEVIVGIVGRPHGVRGEVSVEPRTDEPERRFAPGCVLHAEGTTRRFTVAASRRHGGRLLVSFDEIRDRTAAESARGLALAIDVPPGEGPAAAEEYYDRQLIGLRVLTHDGTMAGRVSAVLHMVAQDLLVIEGVNGERLVPFVSQLVPQVDLAGGSLTLADVPGLLVDEESDVAAPDQGVESRSPQ